MTVTIEHFNKTFDEIKREVIELAETDMSAALSVCNAYTRMHCYLIALNSSSSEWAQIKVAIMSDLCMKTTAHYFKQGVHK